MIKNWQSIITLNQKIHFTLSGVSLNIWSLTFGLRYQPWRHLELDTSINHRDFQYRFSHQDVMESTEHPVGNAPKSAKPRIDHRYKSNPTGGTTVNTHWASVAENPGCLPQRLTLKVIPCKPRVHQLYGIKIAQANASFRYFRYLVLLQPRCGHLFSPASTTTIVAEPTLHCAVILQCQRYGWKYLKVTLLLQFCSNVFLIY